MKAVICTKYGPPEVLRLQAIDKPIPTDNEVLIKIFATNVTAGDVRIRSFNVPLSFWLPARLILGIRKPKNAILGTVFAGQVAEVGKNVRNYKVGQDVFGSAEDHGGAYAEYICMPSDGSMSIMPNNLNYNEASSIIWGGCMSLFFLQKAEILPGQKILVYGASGSLGTSAIQLAKYFKAEVTGVCSSKNLDLVKSLGADHVIDYQKEDCTFGQEKYDIVYDTVGKMKVSDAIRALKPNGKYVHAVTTPGVEIGIKLALLGTKKILIGGTSKFEKPLLETVKKLAEANILKPIIDKIYPIEEISEAHRYVDIGHKRGNVVVTV
jgi:NADPH:quinone reductase-like Zn-dependent oxidoreductase